MTIKTQLKHLEGRRRRNPNVVLYTLYGGILYKGLPVDPGKETPADVQEYERLCQEDGKTVILVEYVEYQEGTPAK